MVAACSEQPWTLSAAIVYLSLPLSASTPVYLSQQKWSWQIWSGLYNITVEILRTLKFKLTQASARTRATARAMARTRARARARAMARGRTRTRARTRARTRTRARAMVSSRARARPWECVYV